MKVIGLTGGMAAGKSTLAACFRRQYVPVFDADSCVKSLQSSSGKALPLLEKYFPGVVHHQCLDRAALRKHLITDPQAFKKLEAIMHPLVKRERENFIRVCRRQRRKFCVLDIPLLWESGAYRECDSIIVAYAPLRVRLERLQKRFHKEKKMSVQEARHFMKRQLAEEIKRKRADYVIQTGLSRAMALRQSVFLTRKLQNPYFQMLQEG